jgi:DNA uptake protein ComE-like DNA-binding protein
MNRIRAILRLTFGFSSTESNAFIVLLPLMLIVIVSEPVYQTYFVSSDPDDFKYRKTVDSLVAIWKTEEKKTENKTKRAYSFPDKNRKKFTDAGSRFKPRQSKTKSQQPAFDLNAADTTQLKTIYGIGPVIAKRIINYRTNLGGFVDFNQLYEVWGLDSTVISRLTEKTVIAPGFTPNKLPINHCSEQDLSRHPYLRTKLARAIVNYRHQHGNFTSVDDLKKINIMEEKVFLRIKPYINLD